VCVGQFSIKNSRAGEKMPWESQETKSKRVKEKWIKLKYELHNERRQEDRAIKHANCK